MFDRLSSKRVAQPAYFGHSEERMDGPDSPYVWSVSFQAQIQLFGDVPHVPAEPEYSKELLTASINRRQRTSGDRLVMHLIVPLQIACDLLAGNELHAGQFHRSQVEKVDSRWQIMFPGYFYGAASLVVRDTPGNYLIFHEMKVGQEALADVNLTPA